MIYVDQAIFKRSPRGRKSYAHMIASSLDELHEFALRIGVKRHFFHRSKFLHYDITAKQRDVALRAGAVGVTSKELIAKYSHADQRNHTGSDQ